MERVARPVPRAQLASRSAMGCWEWGMPLCALASGFNAAGIADLQFSMLAGNAAALAGGTPLVLPPHDGIHCKHVLRKGHDNKSEWQKSRNRDKRST